MNTSPMPGLPDTCLRWQHHRWSAIWSHTADDVSRYLTKSPHDLARGQSWRRQLSAWLTPEVFPVFLYRLSHYLEVNRWRRLAGTLSRMNYFLHKLSIPPDSCIGPGLRLPHPATVTFHGTAGRGLTLYAQSLCCAYLGQWGAGAQAGPRLGDHVSLGAQSLVQGPVSVADGTRLAHMAVLTTDAPAGVIVAPYSLRIHLRPNHPPVSERATQ